LRNIRLVVLALLVLSITTAGTISGEPKTGNASASQTSATNQAPTISLGAVTAVTQLSTPPTTPTIPPPITVYTRYPPPQSSTTSVIFSTTILTTTASRSRCYWWNGNYYYDYCTNYFDYYNGYYYGYYYNPTCYGYDCYSYNPNYGPYQATTITDTSYSIVTETSTSTTTSIPQPATTATTLTNVVTISDTTMETVYGSLMVGFLALFVVTLFLLMMSRSRIPLSANPQPQQAHIETSFKCSACGTDIISNAKFCGNCGAMLKR